MNWKSHEKNVTTSIKQDLSPDLNLLYYAIRGVLENKTSATSYPNIGSLKIAIEKEWNKISEEFILKTWKSCLYNKWKKMVAILSKFTVLCLSSYFVVFLIKINLVL